MARNSRTRGAGRRDLSFVLLATLLVTLLIAGGASRADVLGQAIVRLAAWGVLIVAFLSLPRPDWRAHLPVVAFLLAAIVVTAGQLLPLPPALWMQLPGRELLAQSAEAIGQPQPWRPLTISPDATLNGLVSLIVPVAVCGLMIVQRQENHRRLVVLLLGLIVVSAFIGLVQFAGMRFDHPLINDVGAVSGNFANRNHFALFAAFGCVLAPTWAYGTHHREKWQPIAMAGLLMFLILVILASGSRSGMIMGLIGLGLGLLATRGRIMDDLRHLPRRASLAIVGASVGTLIAAVFLSIRFGRAISVERLQSLDAGDDLRRTALPTVVQMTERYWPAGTGYGTFDPAYRISEPAFLLNRSYFNHAHNDVIEIVLDGGLAGLLLLVSAVVWIGWRGFCAWRAPAEAGTIRARAGFSLLLLTFLASVTDYPARTPMIMAVVIMAAVWLSGLGRSGAQRESALGSPAP